MRATAFVVLMLVAACRNPGRLTPPRTGPMAPGDDRRQPGTLAGQVQAAANEWSSRKVTAKEDPNRLYSADRYTCTVSESKYREVSVGESVLCAWSR